jgi:hypothetical protein
MWSRLYERLGLLPGPARSTAGYRLGEDASVARLRFLKGAQGCLARRSTSASSVSRSTTRCGAVCSFCEAMGREVSAITARDATVLLDLFAPTRRGPLPCGATRAARQIVGPVTCGIRFAREMNWGYRTAWAGHG